MSVQTTRSRTSTIVPLTDSLVELGEKSESRATPLPPEVVDKAMQLLGNRIVGQEELKLALKTILLTGGSLHASGDVGLGKTSTVKAIVKILNKVLEEGNYNIKVNYVRISGTPDLMPEDLRGDWTVNEEGKVVFQPGVLYNARKRKEDGKDVITIVHFDEIDKVPDRTRNALLDAMAEQRIVMKQGEEVPLNMIVIATSNIGSLEEGMERLERPISDRFMFSNVRVRRLTYDELLKILNINLGIPDDDLVGRIAAGIVWLSYSDESIRRLMEEPLSPRAAISLTEAVKSQLKILMNKGVDRIDLASVFLGMSLPLLRDRFTPSLEGERIGKDKIIKLLVEEAFRRFFRE